MCCRIIRDPQVAKARFDHVETREVGDADDHFVIC
jgi:hypothetical protein